MTEVTVAPGPSPLRIPPRGGDAALPGSDKLLGPAARARVPLPAVADKAGGPDDRRNRQTVAVHLLSLGGSAQKGVNAGSAAAGSWFAPIGSIRNFDPLRNLFPLPSSI